LRPDIQPPFSGSCLTSDFFLNAMSLHLLRVS
jgi:hypothetical protein